MKNLYRIILVLIIISIYSGVIMAQNGKKLIVIPSAQEGQELCTLLDKSLIHKEAIQVLNKSFQDKGFQVINFIPISKVVKARGGSNPDNLEQTIQNIVKTSKCHIYVVAQINPQKTSTGNYVSLSLTGYDASSGEYLSYQSARSNKFNSTNWVALTKQAFGKIAKPLIAELNIVPTQSTQEAVTNTVKPIEVETDINIPTVNASHPNRYALIIGNEDYSSFQKDLKSEVNVDFAQNDARIFGEYAQKTLGIPQDNIIMLINARAIEMHQAVSKISLIAKNCGGNAEIIFYYAGHGFPDEKTKEAYLIPVDVSGTDLQFAIKLKEIYSKLTQYPCKRITVFLDACFSGGARNQGLLAARGVKMKPKKAMLHGNVVVFTASSGQESSLPYHDKQHGIFTYFLLKKLQSSQGNTTYRELSDYLRKQVGVKSVILNSKEQTPQTNVSPSAQGVWGDWKMN